MTDDLKLSMINQAMTAAREEPVVELTGQNPFTIAANLHYDQIVEEELERALPKFAMRVSSPSLESEESDEPLKYRWTLPSDVIATVAVLYKGIVLEGEFYEIEGRTIRTYYNTDITAKYCRRVAEDSWSPTFRRIVIDRLTALFMRVAEEHGIAQKMDEATEYKSRIHRHSDSRTRANKPLGSGSILEARFGLRTRR